MRAVLVTCIFYILLNIVICDDEALDISPHIIQSYPKEIKKYRGLELKLKNRRYRKEMNTDTPIRTKKHTENSYTVFAVNNDNNAMLRHAKFNVPDSPYFPFVKHVDEISSIKKTWNSRKKRSADEKSDGDIQDKKTESVTEPQSTTAPQQSSTSTPQQSSTTQSQQSITITPQQSSTSEPQQSSTTKPLVKESTIAKANTPVASVTEAKVSKASQNSSRKNGGKRGLARSKIQKPRRNNGVVKGVKKVAKKQAKRTGADGKKRKSKRVARRKSVKAPNSKKLVAGRRLIAGRDALVEDYPYVVSIQKDDEHWCSGALLNQRLVITTANCVWKASRMSRLRVRAGTRFSDRGGQFAKIQEVMKHPGWSIRDRPDYDVALILIDRNIRFSHNVHAVDLPNRVMMPPFDDAWVTSWGAERRDGIYEKKGLSLQTYHARLMDRDKCNNITKRYGVLVTENFICLSQTGRQAPCTRDTGAPAVSDGILWGLASWGIRKLCGTERFPAMFSYIASHSNMDFIANATRFLMSDDRQYPFGDKYVYPVSSTIQDRGPAAPA